MEFVKVKAKNSDDNDSYQTCEDYMAIDESEVFASKFIEQCIDNLFVPFTFDTYCINMNGSSERRITCYFKNVDHVGSYCEKYVASVFEESENSVYNCVGSQVSVFE